MKICLDAGHAGKCNPYIVAGKTIGYESEVAWKLCERLASELRKAGVEVICTRKTPEEDPGLEERGRMSDGCELFLSLHTNAGAETADYPLACCAADGSADGIGLRLARTVQSVMQTKQGARLWKRDWQTGKVTALLSERDDGFGKRAYQKDYYGVLRGAAQVGTPGVLLECSFHTHPVMARWLTDDKNLDTLAKALCDALVTRSMESREEKYQELLRELALLLDRYRKE